MLRQFILVILFILSYIGPSASSTSLIGLTFEILDEVDTITRASNSDEDDLCVGHRCDTDACPCGCECGNSHDSGVCYVPKQFKLKKNN